MRQRNQQVKVRMTDTEHASFKRLVEKSRLSQEEYLRQLINGVVPMDAPPPDYFRMMRQLYKVGNNLNQIARKAHVLGVIDTQKYDLAIRDYNKTVLEITKAVTLPRKAPHGNH